MFDRNLRALRSPTLPRALFVIYAVVSALSVAGYWGFVLNPANLARLSAFPWIQSFYGVAFALLAQLHIVLGILWIVAYLWVNRVSGALAAFAGVVTISFLSEYAGTTTGLPFGRYAYTGLLGPRILGHVPVLIPISWFVMAVPSYLIAESRFPRNSLGRVVLGAALLTAWDLSLDPSMSFLGSYWVWTEPGVFYGMPLINLAGWFATSLAVMLFVAATGALRTHDDTHQRPMVAFYILTLALPIGLVLTAGLWPAVVLGAGVPLLLLLAAGAFRPIPAATHPASAADNAADGVETILRSAAGEVVGLSDLDAFFRVNSRSFWFAARWFRPEQREVVQRVYAYCRATDDIVDRASNRTEARAALNAWRSLTLSAYSGSDTGVRWLDDLMSESKKRGVPFALIDDLLTGVASDLDTVRVADWEELSVYCYRVGSVVGLWLSRLFGVSDASALQRARALGHAMQLTNVVRDVGEDLRLDRLYLPADLLERYGLDVHELKRMQEDGQVSPAYVSAMREVMSRADDLYAFSEDAIPELPPGFRGAVAVAARVYRGIQREVERNGYDNLTRRARTTGFRKAILAVQAVAWLRRERRRGSLEPAKRLRPEWFEVAD